MPKKSSDAKIAKTSSSKAGPSIGLPSAFTFQNQLEIPQKSSDAEISKWSFGKAGPSFGSTPTPTFQLQHFAPTPTLKRTESFDSSHSTKITSTLHGFRASTKNCCDVTLEADGEKFEAHKCVLVSLSEYFDKLFNSNMKEKYEETVKITEISADTLKLVLDFIYTSKIKLDIDNVYKVLAAADYLMIPYLKGFCCKFLLDEQNPQNSLKVWTSGRKYNASDLEIRSGIYISHNFLKICEEKNFMELDLKEFKLAVLLKNESLSNKEEDAFQLIVAWVKYDKENRKEMFPELFALLNLQKMSSFFLSTVVKEQSILLDYSQVVRNVILRISEDVTPKDLHKLDTSTSIGVLSRTGELRKFNFRNNFQQKLSSMSVLRQFKGSVKSGAWIYLFGVPNNYEAVKFNLDEPYAGWKKIPRMPSSIDNDTLVVAGHDSSLYLTTPSSGFCFGVNVLMFNTISESWETKDWTNYLSSKQTCVAVMPKGLLYFPSWKLYDFSTKQFSNFNTLTQVTSVEKAITLRNDFYLFSKGGDSYNVWLYDISSKKGIQISEMKNTQSIRDVCVVNGNIVAVVQTYHEGWLLKEFNIAHKTWRVISGIEDEQDFARIFSLD